MNHINCIVVYLLNNLNSISFRISTIVAGLTAKKSSMKITEIAKINDQIIF